MDGCGDKVENGRRDLDETERSAYLNTSIMSLRACEVCSTLLEMQRFVLRSCFELRNACSELDRAGPL